MDVSDHFQSRAWSKISLSPRRHLLLHAIWTAVLVVVIPGTNGDHLCCLRVYTSYIEPAMPFWPIGVCSSSAGSITREGRGHCVVVLTELEVGSYETTSLENISKFKRQQVTVRRDFVEVQKCSLFCRQSYFCHVKLCPNFLCHHCPEEIPSSHSTQVLDNHLLFEPLYRTLEIFNPVVSGVLSVSMLCNCRSTTGSTVDP